MFGVKFGKNKKSSTPVVETPEQSSLTMADAYNAVKANYGTMAYSEMSPITIMVLAKCEFTRLYKAAEHMPAGSVTPEAIDAYVAEQRKQKKAAGTWVENANDTDERLTRVAANHVLSCTFNRAKDVNVITA
jgi:hypothetical protein